MFRRTLVAIISITVLAAWSYGTTRLADSILESDRIGPWDLGFLRDPNAEPATLEDEPRDVYHPLGDSGIKVDYSKKADLTAVEMSGWAIHPDWLRGEEEFGQEEYNPFDTALTAEDGIRRGGPEDLAFDAGAPYAVFEFQLAGDITYQDLFCEYLVAWRDPMYVAFEGIDGDLFNGTNRVNVVRTGEGVPGGFEVEGLDYMDGMWMPTDPYGFGASDGDRLVHVLPADRFGVDYVFRGIDGLRGQSAAESVFDFNFGAFCSEGGQSFDPALGGVDILQAQVDLASLPVTLISAAAPEVEETTTTAAPPAVSSPTTTAAASATTIAAGSETEDGGGGMSPALIAVIAAAAGGAAYAAWRMARDSAE